MSVKEKHIQEEQHSPTNLADAPSQQPQTQDQSQHEEYPPAKKAFVIMLATMLASFLVSLDRTIVATAIPVITNHFNSLDDVGWYASAYLLTMSSFQMVMGRVYTFFDIKLVFLSCIGLFELGSIVCGAAQNSTTLIVGRAIAGMGATGLFSGAVTIVVHVLPLAKRPAYMGTFGSIFGIASVAGPLLGGAFTSNVSWRWCFFINLPIGGLAMIIIFIILKLPERKIEPLSWKEKLLRLDPLGNLFFIPSIVCLLLALQWGGTTYVGQVYPFPHIGANHNTGMVRMENHIASCILRGPPHSIHHRRDRNAENSHHTIAHHQKPIGISCCLVYLRGGCRSDSSRLLPTYLVPSYQGCQPCQIRHHEYPSRFRPRRRIPSCRLPHQEGRLLRPLDASRSSYHAHRCWPYFDLYGPHRPLQMDRLSGLVWLWYGSRHATKQCCSPDGPATPRCGDRC